MKTLKVLFAIAIACCMFSACELPTEQHLFDDSNYVLAPELSREEAALILYEELTIEGNTILFDMSLSEALELGISEEIYQEYVTTIQDINNFISVTHKDFPDATVSLLDKNEINNEFTYEPQYEFDAARSSRAIPTGRIDALSQEWNASPSFYLSSDFNCFTCHCQAYAALAAVFQVETHFLSAWMHTWVAPLTSYVNKTARVYGSNINGYIRFRTSDSNGGFLGWGAAYQKFED